MSWEKVLKNKDMSEDEYRRYYGDGSETDFQQFRNPPKGNKRIKIIKEAFAQISEAGHILDAAATWSSPEKYQEMASKIVNLLKEIRSLEKEAIEHHSKGGPL
jgi:hypothetical protein